LLQYPALQQVDLIFLGTIIRLLQQREHEVNIFSGFIYSAVIQAVFGHEVQQLYPFIRWHAGVGSCQSFTQFQIGGLSGVWVFWQTAGVLIEQPLDFLAVWRFLGFSFHACSRLLQPVNSGQPWPRRPPVKGHSSGLGIRKTYSTLTTSK